MQLLHITFQKNCQNNSTTLSTSANSNNMKKEILELVVLGLQAKELVSVENIVNALASLPEKQQHQWIEAMLPTKSKLETITGKVLDDSTMTCVLKVTPKENASKLEIIAYVKRLLKCSLIDARDLVFNNKTFELEASLYNLDNDIKKLRDMNCIVEIK